jgi:hypothetical protein
MQTLEDIMLPLHIDKSRSVCLSQLLSSEQETMIIFILFKPTHALFLKHIHIHI